MSILSKLIADQELIIKVMMDQGNEDVARAGMDVAASLMLMQEISLEDSGFDLLDYNKMDHKTEVRRNK